jgi:hypothetical protein
MRLVLRIAGTWLIGLAFVLLVVDGTRSLAANGVLLTTLGSAWNGLHPTSLLALGAFAEGQAFAALFDQTLAGLLDWPAFAVAGVPGLLLVMLGRVPQRERFLRHDQI